MEQKRLLLLDTMRGFALFSVIYSHIILFWGNFQYDTWLNHYFCVFQMPLFFFVSGFLSYSPTLTSKKLEKGLLKKIISQVLPALIILLPRKVAYNDEACRYNYIKNWIERKRLDSIEPIYHKSAVWSYEDEYRVVRIDGAGFMNFNIEAIRSICFGSKTPANVIDEVKALCEKKNYNHITFTKIHIDPATGHHLRQPV